MFALIREILGFKRVRSTTPAPTELALAVAFRCWILLLLIATIARTTMAEEPGVTKPEPTRSSFFRLPGFLQRGRESGSRKTQPNRFIARASQLLAQARSQEADGKPEDALESARRAESVLIAAQHTTGTRWPTDMATPTQYITALKRRTGVSDKPATSKDKAMFSPGTPRLPEKTMKNNARQSMASNSRPIVASQNRAVTDIAELGETVGPPELLVGASTHVRTPASARVLPTHSVNADPDSLLLNWDDRTPASAITLVRASQADQQPSNTAHSADETDEADLLLQQLGKLETWSNIEPTAGAASEARSQDAAKFQFNEPKLDSPPPLLIPGLIDRPDEIEDQNVAPIPTQCIEGPNSEATTTTIPVVPEATAVLPNPAITIATRDAKSNSTEHDTGASPSVYDVAPRLLTQSDETKSATAATSKRSTASIWQLAAALLVSTFLGVMLAVGLFLVIRAAALKIFGTRLGITIQIVSGSDSSTQTRTDEESAEVVQFGVSTSQPHEPRRAGGVADPADFPFRIVGGLNGEDEPTSEDDTNHERETAILKSVFDHNLDLMSELDQRNQSAA